MATIAGTRGFTERRPDLLSGTPRAHSIDRWIFVITAAWFIVIVLAGFVPDSIMKIGMVEAGQTQTAQQPRTLAVLVKLKPITSGEYQR